MPVGFRKKKTELETPRQKKAEKTVSTEAQSKPVKEKTAPVFDQYQASSPSLQNIAYTPDNQTKETEKKPEVVQNGPTESFTETQLIDAWNVFAQTVEQSLPRLYQVLKTHLPEKRSEELLNLKLDNISQQKDFMEKIHSKLMTFLKKTLNNHRIELTVEVLEEISNQQLVYTASDKFNYLAEQNELLHQLKHKFNLDLE